MDEAVDNVDKKGDEVKEEVKEGKRLNHPEVAELKK